METKLITIKEYIALLKNSNEGHITMYHESLWLEVISNSFNSELMIAVTLDDKGQILALTPYMNLKKGLFSLIGSPLSGLYTELTGPIFKEGSTEKEIEVILSQINFLKTRAQYIEISIPNNVVLTEEDCKKNSLRQEIHKSISINLKKEKEDIWNDFEGRARNMIRKSEKNHVSVSEVTPTIEWMEKYYLMLNHTFSSQKKVTPHPFIFFKELIKLHSQGKVICFSAFKEGINIANAIFLNDRSRLLYLSGTSNQEGMKTAANSLIQWQAIQSAIDIGVQEYDMGGLGIGSIDKFKRSFGGEEIQRRRLVYRSTIFSLLEPLARWAREKGIISVSN